MKEQPRFKLYCTVLQHTGGTVQWYRDIMGMTSSTNVLNFSVKNIPFWSFKQWR